MTTAKASERENLRTGFTTGACAAAASKGALLALIRRCAILDVEIDLPGGRATAFILHSSSFTQNDGSASVIKDAGDDPDVTHRAEICSRVEWTQQSGIVFLRGVGVGVVTRRGLPVPVGEPAINPAPRQLIADTIRAVLVEHGLEHRGVAVEISVPNGEELAKKTFNPRLGIVGGISILGTTGIVIPYSTAAWVASVTQEIDVASADGLTELVLTVGARGERLARGLFSLRHEAFVQIGPFFGAALRHCAKAGIAKVNLVGMIGKLAKFAAGNDSVHSSDSRQDFGFLAEAAATAGAEASIVQRIAGANTAEEVAELVGTGLPSFFESICRRAWEFARTFLPEALGFLQVCLTSQQGEIRSQFSAVAFLSRFEATWWSTQDGFRKAFACTLQNNANSLVTNQALPAVSQ